MSSRPVLRRALRWLGALLVAVAWAWVLWGAVRQVAAEGPTFMALLRLVIEGIAAALTIGWAVRRTAAT